MFGVSNLLLKESGVLMCDVGNNWPREASLMFVP
jgi:hypothetical protein